MDSAFLFFAVFTRAPVYRHHLRCSPNPFACVLLNPHLSRFTAAQLLAVPIRVLATSGSRRSYNKVPWLSSTEVTNKMAKKFVPGFSLKEEEPGIGKTTIAIDSDDDESDVDDMGRGPVRRVWKARRARKGKARRGDGQGRREGQGWERRVGRG